LRPPAIVAARHFLRLMDRLKTEAVFWKQERETFGERWIESTDRDTQDREMMK